MANPTFRPQQRSAIPASMPAPYKGLNTVDSLAEMDPDYGLSIQNFVCTPQGLSVRHAYRKWATGLPTTTTSLLPYHGKNSTTSKLFAVSGTAIYDVTTSGAVGSPVVTGLTASSPYWQQAVQTTSTGTNGYLITVNGVDFPRMYDGTSWTTCSQVTTPSAPGQFKTLDNNGAAVNIQSFVDILLHQQRLWFVAANSTKAYYCDIAQAGGALYAFDFGPLFPTGGKLFKLATFTGDMEGTLGNQAILVALSDKGDVVIFTGNNPAIASSWAMSGQFKIGSPVGRRCTTPYEGDLLVLTQDGLYPLSKYNIDGRTNSADAITYKISPTISNLVSQYATTPGFEVAVYPGNDVMLLNVPQSIQANNFQFCMQSQTMGWTQFTGWPAQCFGLFNDALYFGGPDHIGLAFIGFQDGADINGVGGNNIVATAMSAFSTMDTQTRMPGCLKQATQVKPFIITGSSNPQISVGVNTDFNLTPIVGSATVTPASGAVWDNATWDNTSATWVGSLNTFNKWTSVSCYPAYYVAVVISVSATTDTLWSATNFLLTPGGPYG